VPTAHLVRMEQEGVNSRGRMPAGDRRRDGARERADVMLQDGQRTLSVLLSRSQLATSPPTSLITVTRVPRQRPFTDDRSGSHANPASCRQHGRRQFLGHVGLAYHGGCA
jgi:hypothetical protein